MICNKVAEKRKKAGMSLYDLAKKSGVAYSILYYLEHNARDIQISTAFKIARALECTIDDLFENKPA